MQTFYDMSFILPDEYEGDKYKWQFVSDLRDVFDPEGLLFNGDPMGSSNDDIYKLLQQHGVCDSVDCADNEFACCYLYFYNKTSAKQFINRLNAFANDHPEYLRKDKLPGNTYKWELIMENLKDVHGQISSIHERPAGLLGKIDGAIRQIQEEALEDESVTA